MPPQAPAPTGLKDASWDDVITAVAKQHGVNPQLALAIARKESGMNPGAIGDSGKAIGLFQMHSGAAADTGVTDRNDPIQNITGGVKYLRQLSDRYQGDVSKTLQAYNGGLDNVDKGTISPAAQAYAAEIMAEISKSMRQTQMSPAETAATKATTIQPGPGMVTQGLRTARALVEPLNPMTPEGRENLVAGAGSAAMLLATRGLPVGALATRIATVLGPVLGGATAGAGARAVEETIGTVQPHEGMFGEGSIADAGLKQGAYDFGGQMMMWIPRRLARTATALNLAPKVATQLKSTTDAVRRGTRDAIDTAVSAMNDAISKVRGENFLAADAAKTTERAAVRSTRAAANARLAQVELDNAAQVVAATKTYDDLLSQAPSLVGTGDVVKQTLGGPTKRALDLAGQQVVKAAESGPALPGTPLVDALDAMAAEVRPPILFAKQKETPGIGFLANIGAASRQGAAATATPEETTRLNQIIAQQLGIPVEKMDPRLPGLLGQIQQLRGKQIDFADLHKIKMLLDETVNWDRTAKKHLERITKGLRTTLREMMAVHQPYNEATAAYHAVVPLYRKGVGKQIIKLANEPDGAQRLAQVLKGSDASKASALRQLLVDQSAAGGDAQLGQQAWDQVRAAYTHEHLLSGGIAKLGDRIEHLLTIRPDFVRTVYGDQPGAAILSNLGQIAESYKVAVAKAAEEKTATKAAGTAATNAAREQGEAATLATKRAGTERLEQARRAGKSRVQEARRMAEDAQRGMAGTTARFKESSLAKFAQRTPEGEIADFGRAVMLGPRGSFYGLKSLVRLLQSPNAADVLEWAAFSNYNTSRLTKILTSPVTPAVVAGLLREIGGALNGRPVAPVPAAPPDATAGTVP